MTYDRQIIISIGNSRKSTRWPASTLWWSELVERLRTPVRGVESLNDYLAQPKSRQDDLKDVGGFVAGSLQGNKRKANSVTGRDVVTLDLDNIRAGGTADVIRRLEGLNCGYCVYSTRKHEEARPRLRVLLPLYRTCTADEYEPLARKMAEIIGIEMCDPSTFEASRLMYWPSCSADSVYVYTFGDKPMLDVDGLLARYNDWHNFLEWPQVPGTENTYTRLAAKQGDPLDKSGVVGAFCKVYDIYRTMDEVLPGIYEPTDIPGRYTYTGGSTTGGAVIYDDGRFLYSHHATDPCSGRLVNSFDLVRLHKFSDADDNVLPGTPTNRLPSYNEMCRFAVADANVATMLNTERYEAATEAFNTPLDVDDTNWMSKLKTNYTTGKAEKTVNNVLIILENDPLLKGKLAFDEFANRGLALGALPWDGRAERRQWTDTDDAGMRYYIEKVYEISGKERILDGTALCAFKQRINDVQDYLKSLKWDGVRRLDTLLTDYLGAVDNVYTRQVIRKSLAAAVARAMDPGCKYDYMPIFSGPQGLGKSTFLRLLGLRWYNDSLSTFEGKEAAEMVQGSWINELGELNGLSRSETNAVKQFLSRNEDIYREPYGRRTNLYPRRCVFFGTTNDKEFLRDNTGERRFWPVDVGMQMPFKNVFRQLADEVPQIWAEAFVVWQLGEFLDLSGEARGIWSEEVKAHKVSNVKEGIILDFLQHQLPPDWEKRKIRDRQLYWSGEFESGAYGAVGAVERRQVCAAEIWCECFNKDISWMKQADTREINTIMEGIPGWYRHTSSQRFGPYGIQRGFKRYP